MIYSSKHNPLIKEIASLNDKKHRNALGLYIAEGIKMVNEAIQNNLPIKYIVATENVLNDILTSNYEVLLVTKEVFSYLSDEKTPQGALAVIKIPNLKCEKPLSNGLILDGVSNPGNVGTIIRTAAAFGYKDIYLINCADPFSGKAVRSSMSGVYFVRLFKTSYKEIKEFLGDYKIIVADMKGESLNTFNPPKKHMIVVGNEANGVSKEMLELCDNVVSIPMEDKSESLNVAVASSIMMYNLKIKI